MPDKHAERTCTLNIHTRGGAVIVVPGITVDKAESYSAVLFDEAAKSINGHTIERVPVALFGNDGLTRVKVLPSEVAGTSIFVAAEGKNPWSAGANPWAESRSLDTQEEFNEHVSDEQAVALVELFEERGIPTEGSVIGQFLQHHPALGPDVIEMPDGSYIANGGDEQIPLGTPVDREGVPLDNPNGNFS